MGYFLANLIQPDHRSRPNDKELIYGTGDVKTISVREGYIATYTLKVVDDPNTLNKTLHIRPPANVYLSVIIS